MPSKFIGWYFSPRGGDDIQGGVSGDQELFKGSEKKAFLVRETIQNSLDAAAEPGKKPVRVVFKIKDITIADYPAIADFEQNVKNCENYWGSDADSKLSEKLKKAKDVYKHKTVPCLVISDYNTTGASDASDLSPWKALTGANGMSVKSSDTSGGSYGIGKNVCFACSDLNIVFYNTYVPGEGSRFMGTARLATTLDREIGETHADGKYRYNDPNTGRYGNFRDITDDDEDAFRDLFKRTEAGTDIIIPAFSDLDDFDDTVLKAAIENFFVALKENLLVVEIENGGKHTVLDADSIDRMLAGYAKSDETMMSVKQYVMAYENPTEACKATILEKDDLDIRILMVPDGGNAVMCFRGNGMYITKFRKSSVQNYAAVAVARGDALAETLRSMEAPNHNKWDPALVEDKIEQRNAVSVLRKIKNSIGNLISDLVVRSEKNIINADDAACYLPSGLGNALGDGREDVLRPVVEIIDQAKKVPRKPRISDNGNKTEDGETRGHKHNESPNEPDASEPSNGYGYDYPHAPGNNIRKDPVKIGSEQNGRVLIAPRNIRAFPLNADGGVYKVVWYPERDYNNLSFSFKIIGENGRSDAIAMKKFTFRQMDMPLKEHNGVATGINVKMHEWAEFNVMFEQTGKMMLEISIEEES